MTYFKQITLAASIVLTTQTGMALAENRIDMQRPDAPALAAYGTFKVGVQTIKLVHANQIDILKVDPKKPKPEKLPRYDRPLTVEVWYPAASNAKGSTALKVFLRDGETEVEIKGKAMRDAAPVTTKAPFPLVIISHGYPGNRLLLSHLAENLASKGYIVASIDHTDSTYRDKKAFGSTLVNRTHDQLFLLNEMDRLSKEKTSFLNGLLNASNTGIIGYSMGAYGAVITAGGGVTQASVDYAWGGPHGTLAVHKGGSKSHTALFDPRIKTAIAIAPWGMKLGFWSPQTLKGVKLPMLFVSGSNDDVAGYKKGTRLIWKNSINVDRSLLTFQYANHNAAAPMPAPAESYAVSKKLGYAPFDHYADPVWDTTRMNNIMQHFATAWMGKYLKKEKRQEDGTLSRKHLVPASDDSVWSRNKDGSQKADDTYWKGFAKRTAKGLLFERLLKGQ